ncbi:MFS transporter [Ornithinimicrobium faecis]|uniref:MFS transporter n=1 Tax=Ornithinimicrobium faecis TaxID=2934158 RepID=A0ABY4YZC5_9MICO|nr:MFS transporter [Ornithinimicrobium sp. HY1793]USQ81874.1 MFS transporter [Ornithinimicrobium sp. HY1793]
MSLQDFGADDLVIRSVRWFTATAAAESVGDSLARSLLPIVAVATLGAGTVTVGLLNALGLLAFLVLALPVGVLADRWSAPIRMMTLSSLVRAAVTFAGVLAWWVGWLEGPGGLVVLVLMALVVGVADVVFTAGQGLLVPRLVPGEQIRAVFGRMQSAAQAGAAVGPLVLSGVLLVLAAPVAWLCSTVMYLLSVLTQSRIRPQLSGPPQLPRTSMWAQAQAGTGELFSHPALARVTVANMLNNAAVMAANTLLPVIALSRMGLSPTAYAAIGVGGALAGIAGAIAASGITERVGLRATRLMTSAGMSLGVVLVMLAGAVVPVLPGPPLLWLALRSMLAGGCASIAMVAGSDLAPRLVSPQSLGTVMGAQRVLVLGTMPVDAVAIGILGVAVGIPAASWVWLTLALGSAIPCFALQDPTTSNTRTS